MALILTVLAVFVLLVSSEIWWRRRVGHGEFSRKFIHITVGSFVAVWPFYLSWSQIEILSVAFLLVVIVSKYLGVFQAIHSVQRPTWGEVFFGAAVGLTALLTHNKWIYCAALLQMSLADGMAAVVGTRFGTHKQYLVFGHAKSVVGTMTFFVVSLSILIIFNHHLPSELAPAQIIGLSLVASVLENIGVQGLDNLLVPVLIAVALVNI